MRGRRASWSGRSTACCSTGSPRAGQERAPDEAGDTRAGNQSASRCIQGSFVIEFLGLPDRPKLVESKLEQALLDNLQHFLLELGKGFAFVSRQERITLDGDQLLH